MGLILLCISGLFLLVGSIQTESGVEGALIYNKEVDRPYRSFAPLERELSVFEEDQRRQFYPMEFLQHQPESVYMRPANTKRGDKGILLDVGDFVINGGPHSGDLKGDSSSKSYLLKSPSILRVGGMMRNSG